MDNITVVIITYKSEKKVFDLINKIPKNIKIIVIEKSENHKLKEKIKNEYKNAKVYVIENNGVSTSLNFAAKKIETKYQFNTDSARKNKIFGSPSFVVNNEIFWGDDRMEDAIKWAKRK